MNLEQYTKINNFFKKIYDGCLVWSFKNATRV